MARAKLAKKVRREHSPATKQAVVNRIAAGERVHAIAKDLKLSENLIYTWKRNIKPVREAGLPVVVKKINTGNGNGSSGNGNGSHAPQYGEGDLSVAQRSIEMLTKNAQLELENETLRRTVQALKDCISIVSLV